MSSDEAIDRDADQLADAVALSSSAMSHLAGMAGLCGDDFPLSPFFAVSHFYLSLFAIFSRT
jgi:hypothetical protein